MTAILVLKLVASAMFTIAYAISFVILILPLL